MSACSIFIDYLIHKYFVNTEIHLCSIRRQREGRVIYCKGFLFSPRLFLTFHSLHLLTASISFTPSSYLFVTYCLLSSPTLLTLPPLPFFLFIISSPLLLPSTSLLSLSGSASSRLQLYFSLARVEKVLLGPGNTPPFLLLPISRYLPKATLEATAQDTLNTSGLIALPFLTAPHVLLSVKQW